MQGWSGTIISVLLQFDPSEYNSQVHGYQILGPEMVISEIHNWVTGQYVEWVTEQNLP